MPNSHAGDIGVGLLAVILQQADITRAQWEDVANAREEPRAV